MSVFKGNRSFYKFEISDILSYNLKNWVDYGLLELGAYTAAKFDLPTSGLTNLKAVYDPRYGGAGRVYEGMGPSWAWETDVSTVSGANDSNVFQVSGVYINNTFYPIGTSGVYSFYVDYLNGRVIFDNAQSGINVKAEYVFRDIDVFSIDSHKWKTIVDEYSKRFEDLEELSPSGMASILKEHRVWLPCVVVDVRETQPRPLQLGGGEIVDAEIDYHIFSENSYVNRRIGDTLNNQYHKRLNLYDISSAPHPYYANGALYSGALTYPQLANRHSEYFWTNAHIDESMILPMRDDGDLYRSTITHSISTDRYLSTY